MTCLALGWKIYGKMGATRVIFFTFVDDERIGAPSENLACHASHKLDAIQSYLGIIDAARKVRPCSQMPDARGMGWGGGAYLENAGGMYTNIRREVEQAQENTG